MVKDIQTKQNRKYGILYVNVSFYPPPSPKENKARQGFYPDRMMFILYLLQSHSCNYTQ